MNVASLYREVAFKPKTEADWFIILCLSYVFLWGISILLFFWGNKICNVSKDAWLAYKLYLFG